MRRALLHYALARLNHEKRILDKRASAGGKGVVAARRHRDEYAAAILEVEGALRSLPPMLPPAAEETLEAA